MSKPAKPIDPSALSQKQLAELLSKAGGKKISPAAIAADVKAGAPTSADGKLNLIHYAAWLAARANEKT